MKNTRIPSRRSWVVAVAVAWSIAPVGIGDTVPLCNSAQAQDRTLPASRRRATEPIRAGLRGVLEQQQQLAITMGSRETQEIIAQGFAQLEALTSDDLAVLQGLEVHISLLQSKTEALHQEVEALHAQLGRPIVDIANLTPWSAQPASSHAPTTLTDADYGIVCSVNPSGFPPFGPNRVLTEVVQAAEVALGVSEALLFVAETVRDVASRACGQVVVLAGVGGNPGNVACLITDAVYVVAKSIDAILRVAFEVLIFCDDDIDSAEIEGAYERAGDIFALNQDIQSELAAHNTNIDGDLADHDANIDGDLADHDANIDGDLAAHDANIDGDLAAHDANIDGDLSTHDADIKAKLALLTGQVVVIQGSLDTKVELRRIHLQIIELKNKQRFLLGAEEGGEPVDVTLLGVMASKGAVYPTGVEFVDVPAVGTPVIGATGFLDVTLDLPVDLQNAKIFQFRVKDTHFDDHGNFSHEHFGTMVFTSTSGWKRQLTATPATPR